MYMDLVLSHYTNGAGSTTSYRIGYLRTVRSIISGTPTELLKPHRKTIADILVDKDMVGSENMLLLAEVASVAQVLASKMISTGGVDIESTEIGAEGYTLFTILISLSSIESDDKVPGYSDMCTSVGYLAYVYLSQVTYQTFLL
jgi:hypothetical protein